MNEGRALTARAVGADHAVVSSRTQRPVWHPGSVPGCDGQEPVVHEGDTTGSERGMHGEHPWLDNGVSTE